MEGVGARHRGEAFGEDYELPNETAYNETCAAIANCMWNQRMFLLKGDAKYFDVLERTLYNGLVSTPKNLNPVARLRFAIRVIPPRQSSGTAAAAHGRELGDQLCGQVEVLYKVNFLYTNLMLFPSPSFSHISLLNKLSPNHINSFSAITLPEILLLYHNS